MERNNIYSTSQMQRFEYIHTCILTCPRILQPLFYLYYSTIGRCDCQYKTQHYRTDLLHFFASLVKNHILRLYTFRQFCKKGKRKHHMLPNFCPHERQHSTAVLLRKKRELSTFHQKWETDNKTDGFDQCCDTPRTVETCISRSYPALRFRLAFTLCPGISSSMIVCFRPQS